MELSAANCRTEQARQLERSMNDLLPNRRVIAARAAEAWGLEALRADERESLHPRALSKEDSEIARQFVEEANGDSGARRFDSLWQLERRDL